MCELTPEEKANVFRMFMHAYCGYRGNDSLEEIASNIAQAKKNTPEGLSVQVEEFKAYTRDESLTFTQKATEMLQFDPADEEEAVQEWKKIWDILTESDPFPFDEHGKRIA